MVLRESNMYMQPDYSNISTGSGGGGNSNGGIVGVVVGSNNNLHKQHHHHQQQQQHHHHPHQLYNSGPASQPQMQAHQPHQTTTKQHAKKLYAKAIYENIAESPDELAFKRGDVLTVIEQDTDGLTGWWLCSLRERTGICPGNRLKIVPTSYDSGCFTPSPLSSPCPSAMSGSAVYANGSSSCSGGSSANSSAFAYPNDLYENTAQKHSKRRSWHIMPNKVVTPQKCGDVYWYDLLPSSSSHHHHHHTPTASLSSASSSQRSSSCSHSTTASSISSSAGNFHSPYHPYVAAHPFHNLLPAIMAEQQQDTYDTPKPAVHISLDPQHVQQQQQQQRTAWSRTSPHASGASSTVLSSPSSSSIMRPDDSYDIPRPSPGLLSQHNITPSSSNSSLLTTNSDSLSLSSSNRSSMANMPDYDVPRRHPITAASKAATPTAPATPMSGANSTYDIPHAALPPFYGAEMSGRASAVCAVPAKKELPLELSSALETLNKLQNEATSAVTRLLGFVSPQWRTKDKLDPVLMDVKLAAVRLRTALHDLAEFGDGALGNAARADDKSLAQKLRPLVKALRDADKLIHEASQMLELQGWSVERLCRAAEPLSPRMPVAPQTHAPPDSLDQLIACAQTLTEDVRQSASFIQGNATLLFKRSLASAPQTPQTPHTPSNGGSESNSDWLEDYDYVSLESKEARAKKNAELRDGLPHDLQTKFDDCLKNADAAAIANDRPTAAAAAAAAAAADGTLNANDKSVLVYYATQTVTHMSYLTQAIDAFLQTVERNQPPKFFLAYGKFVILSAHNLVNIGDIVHRNVSVADVKKRVLQCADALSEALKTCVAKTKKAAQHFPSVTSVQEMVDSVVDISHLAHDLKIAMLQVVVQQ